MFPPLAPNVIGNPVTAVRLEAATGPPRVSVRKPAVSPVELDAGMLTESGVRVSVRDGEVVKMPPPARSFVLGPAILAHQLSEKSSPPPDAKAAFPLEALAVVLFTNRLK